MSLETFFESFAQLAEAPNGVQKLRELILQLAVQGKLVPQDANDEPAIFLLERIQAERARQTAEKVLRKKEALPPIDENELLFELPAGWLLSRIGDLFITSSGTTPNRAKKEYFTEGTENLVKTTHLNNATVQSCEELITKQAVKDCNLKYFLVGTVCIAMYGGSGTIGKSGVLGFESTINQSVCGIYPNPYYEPTFLHIYIKAIRREWMKFAAGLRIDPNINGKIISNMLIPLPPLAEQHRIVAKVDHLMALCDELEAKLRQAQTTSAKLMTATVQHLAQA